jgi:hypothetical protein
MIQADHELFLQRNADHQANRAARYAIAP